eukprot:2333046-Alexandrium_andersonii.AAC.1
MPQGWAAVVAAIKVELGTWAKYGCISRGKRNSSGPDAEARAASQVCRGQSRAKRLDSHRPCASVVR